MHGTGDDTVLPGVTVVVPAYNAGPYLERCLTSLVDQTLERSRYDVIVVDDGSTDGTGERLDRFAGEHPGLIRVEHIENSGWPGRPRNLGTELSRREYVFYCDADDWLLPHGLEVVLARAEADRADVVMVRPVAGRRRVALGLYDKGDRCTNWRDEPHVFSSLTCHKMFRRAFLREREVRFGEGRVRLEDFIFMTTAYLRAERISIVGSQPCYVFEQRDDGGNLTATRATEDEYFSSVEKIIDIVLAEVPAGPEQDRALDRVLHSELLRPMSRPPLLGKPPEVQAQALAHARRLLTTKVPPSAVARLDAVARNHARAVERGDLGAIVRRIEREEQAQLSAVVDDVSWVGPALQLRITLELHRDGAVLQLQREGSTLLMPPAGDAEDAEDAEDADEPVDVTRPFGWTSAPVHVRHRDTGEEWRAVPTLTPVGAAGDRQPMAWTATALVDVGTLAGGNPVRDGVWDLIIHFQSCGYRRLVRPRVAGDSPPAELPVAVRDGRRVRPYRTLAGVLALTVRPVAGDERGRPPGAELRAAARRVARALRRRVRTARRRGRERLRPAR